MGRKRWAERRQKSPGPKVLVEVDEFKPGVIRCGYPYGDGSVCMAPASAEHAVSHDAAVLADELGMSLEPWQERAMGRINWHRTPPMMLAATADDRVIGEGIDQVIRADLAEAYDQLDAERAALERQLNQATTRAPAGSGAPPGQMKPSLYRELTGRPYPRGIATEHGNYPGPTYEALKAASVERAQFTADEAKALLSAALGTRPHLAARVIDQVGPVLAGELARAVDAAVDGRIAKYLAAEKATLDQLYADQIAKLQTEQERRSRDVNAERWATPSRLS